MRFTGTYVRTLINELNYAEVTFCVAKSEEMNKLKDLKDIPLSIDVKIKREKRSLNANAYYWVLAEQIAKELSIRNDRPYTNVDVYREHIKDVGAFYMIPVKKTKVDKFIKVWEEKGLGWICEDMRESNLEGYEVLKCYYGSSEYDTQEMSRLIDLCVADAKELDIETMTPSELQSLKESWR